MTSSFELPGQRILIAGGARGIGLAVADAVSAAGATAIIGARDAERAALSAKGIRNAESVRIDVADESSIVAALAAAGTVNHIVVTASAHYSVPVTELEHDHTVAAFEAKVIGPMLLAKHAAKVLPPTGSIVLFAGVAAWKPWPGNSVTGITNGAVAFAATHLARELAPIRVNAISPGVIDSGRWDSLGDEARRDFLAGAAASTLVGRTGVNADIAEDVLWLLSAGFVSGETIHVEGGARFA